MPEATHRANNAKSNIRSRIEHVFAEKKRMGLFICAIGIARAAVFAAYHVTTRLAKTTKVL